MKPLESFVKGMVRRMMDEELLHVRTPAILCARVTSMAKIAPRTWTYNLRPISHNPNAPALPEIPNVKSHTCIDAGVGGMAAIALINGTPNRVVIVDEVMT